MRESGKGGSYYGSGLTHAPVGTLETDYDEKTFFDSFYKSTVRGRVPTDRHTIGAVSEPESRFHYNVTENSIIRSMLRLNPPPRGMMIEAIQMQESRMGRRHLDIGSGAGHWIDFFRRTFFVSDSIALEISDPMSQFLREKYQDEMVQVLQDDVAANGGVNAKIGGAVDYVTAIGVIFHVVDDARWEQAMANIAAVLKPEGIVFIGGDFGAETKNVQFHKTDKFDSWRELDQSATDPGEIRVNKRVRSLAHWHEVTARCGLSIVDLVRSDRDDSIVTPENDVLVLKLR